MIRDPNTDPIPAPEPATPTVAAPAPMNLAAAIKIRLRRSFRAHAVLTGVNVPGGLGCLEAADRGHRGLGEAQHDLAASAGDGEAGDGGHGEDSSESGKRITPGNRVTDIESRVCVHFAN